MGVSIPLEHNLKGGKKDINQVLWTPCNAAAAGRDRGGKWPPALCHSFVHEMDGYNLLLPHTRVLMVPSLGWGVKILSRETETFLFKSILERGMHEAAESQGKKVMRDALPFFFFPGNEIILLVCLCGKYLLGFFPLFLLTHTHVPVHMQAQKHLELSYRGDKSLGSLYSKVLSTSAL